jgi:alkylhydroperoxidase/carboxymuconolactone decarboxylase family protein
VGSYYLSEDLARFGDIGKTDPARFELFLKWYAAVMEPGALDGKTKKLIAYAVANAIPEPYCIDSYASACTDASITPEELAEAAQVAAAIRGGGVIAHWAQTLNSVSRKE